MDFLKRNKVAIAGGVGVLLVLYVYFTYFSGGSSAALTASDAETPLSTDVVVTLQSIHSIKLNPAVFSDPAFVSLTDFGVIIPPEAVGRRNPFLPIGVNAAPHTQTPNGG
jgi:hypothetical protein